LVQKAIDTCTAAGGGVVLVPPGEYTIGGIQLKDNVELRVEAGATLFASRNAADFPKEWRAVLYANGARNIAVTGRGTIDGLAMYQWTQRRREDEEIREEYAIAEKAGLDMRRWNHAGPGLFLVQFLNSTDVHFRDIHLINSQFWTVRLVYCDRVRLQGVHLYNDLEKAVNGDGIDIVSSSNVTISDSIIVTADDAICLKTERIGGQPARPVENVTVTNSILSSSSTPLMIGTETHADIRHVVFSNCVIRNSNKGVGINVQDGAVVSDVIFSNLTMELNRRHWNWWGSAEVFKFVLKKRTPESKTGAIRNITIDNVTATARGTATMTGMPEQPLENITVRNLRVRQLAEDTRDKRATHAMVFRNIDGLRLENVEVRWDEKETEPKWRSAVVLQGIKDLEMDGLTARQGLKGGQDPVVMFEGVEGGVVRNCRALPGSGVMFGSRGAGTKDVRFTGNDSRGAQKEFEGFPPELKGY
jgi:polygalacturonase